MMTDEELVERLRFGAFWNKDPGMDEAADAIERLTREAYKWKACYHSMEHTHHDVVHELRGLRDEARARERMLLDRNVQLVIDADEARAALADLTRCPIGMDSSRINCSAGSCIECVRSRLEDVSAMLTTQTRLVRILWRKLQAADPVEYAGTLSDYCARQLALAARPANERGQ
jgi:hypothetical protein